MTLALSREHRRSLETTIAQARAVAEPGLGDQDLGDAPVLHDRQELNAAAGAGGRDFRR